MSATLSLFLCTYTANTFFLSPKLPAMTCHSLSGSSQEDSIVDLQTKVNIYKGEKEREGKKEKEKEEEEKKGDNLYLSKHLRSITQEEEGIQEGFFFFSYVCVFRSFSSTYSSSYSMCVWWVQLVARITEKKERSLYRQYSRVVQKQSYTTRQHQNVATTRGCWKRSRMKQYSRMQQQLVTWARFFKHFLVSSDLAATFFRALSEGFCIIFLQKLISEALSNELLAKMVKIHLEVIKQRPRARVDL